MSYADHTARITDARLYRYELPLVQPLRLGEGSCTTRRGVLLEVVLENGRTGWGEAAPLPHFSQDTLASAEHDLRRFASRAAGQAIYLESLLHGIRPASVEKNIRLGPSARFAVESALWDLELQASGAFAGGNIVHINGLLTGSDETVLVRARELANAGFGVLKLKVGRRTPEEDANLVRAVADVCGPEIELRLDANRAWSHVEAVRFFTVLNDVAYEYLEEPLADPTGLPALIRETGARIALDESLLEMEPEGMEQRAFASAIVLKPTLLGGLRRAAAFAERARALGMLPVVSSAYESGVGTRMLALLGSRISPPGTATGLDPYNQLAEDVLMPRLLMTSGTIEVADLLTAGRHVRRDALTPLT